MELNYVSSRDLPQALRQAPAAAILVLSEEQPANWAAVSNDQTFWNELSQRCFPGESPVSTKEAFLNRTAEHQNSTLYSYIFKLQTSSDFFAPLTYDVDHPIQCHQGLVRCLESVYTKTVDPRSLPYQMPEVGLEAEHCHALAEALKTQLERGDGSYAVSIGEGSKSARADLFLQALALAVEKYCAKHPDKRVTLSLRGMGLTEHHVAALLPVITGGKIKTLDLGNNVIGDQGARNLLDACCKGGSLVTQCNLSSNQLTVGILDGLAEKLRRHSMSLDFRENGIPTESVVALNKGMSTVKA